MGISLYNKVPGQIKLKENFNSLKNNFKSFLLKHCFHSVGDQPQVRIIPMLII
jgi:hypothetical protein